VTLSPCRTSCIPSIAGIGIHVHIHIHHPNASTAPSIQHVHPASPTYVCNLCMHLLVFLIVISTVITPNSDCDWTPALGDPNNQSAPTTSHSRNSGITFPFEASLCTTAGM
jgi:hypothetical protein